MSIPDIQVEGNGVLPPIPPKVTPEQERLVEIAAKVQGVSDFKDDEPALDVKPAIDEAEKKEKIKSDQWKPVAIAAAAVALAIIGVFAFSFAAAALIVGTTLLEMSIVVLIGGAAFAGAGLTIYCGLICPGWSEDIKSLQED